MSNILVTGGSGFVGGLIVDKLVKKGHKVYVIDRTIKGWIKHILPEEQLIEMSYSCIRFKRDLQFDTVIHLAAEHSVPDSIKNPKKYYDTNVSELYHFLDVLMDRGGIDKFIFASSASVYGNGHLGQISETDYTRPFSPYGDTKLAGENMLNAYAYAYGFHNINLRFFQPAGADPNCKTGYIQDPPTHLIPTLCNKIYNNEKFIINGNHYPTKDGTCVRDFTHISDVADAVVKSVDLISAKPYTTLNIGKGEGTSVLDVVNIASEILGKEPDYEIGEARTCDPSQLIADISEARMLLGWEPKYNIRDIIQHALNWQVYKEGLK